MSGYHGRSNALFAVSRNLCGLLPVLPVLRDHYNNAVKAEFEAGFGVAPPNTLLPRKWIPNIDIDHASHMESPFAILRHIENVISEVAPLHWTSGLR